MGYKERLMTYKIQIKQFIKDNSKRIVFTQRIIYTKHNSCDK